MAAPSAQGMAEAVSPSTALRKAQRDNPVNEAMTRLAALFFALSATQLPAQPRPSQPAAFDSLVKRHIDARARRDPEWATSVGLHTADDRLTDRSAAAERADSLAAESERRALLAIDTTRLDERRRIDWLLFESVLSTSIADAGLLNWARRPGAYIPFNAVYSLAIGTEPGPRERMASLTARLEGWPAALALGCAQIVAS